MIEIKKAYMEILTSLFLLIDFLGSKFSLSRVEINEVEIGIPLFKPWVFICSDRSAVDRNVPCERAYTQANFL